MRGSHLRWGGALAALLAFGTTTGTAQTAAAGGDSVSFRFIETDLRSIASSLAPYLTKPLMQSGVPGNRASLETPSPVPRSAVAGLLRGLAESNGMELVEDSLSFRLRPRQPDPGPMAVPGQGPGGPVELHVIRLHHARATEIASSVNQLFGNGGDFGGRSGIGRASLSDQLRASAAPAPTPNGAPGGATLSGTVTIVPDEVTNSLLIRSGGGDFALIDSAVAQLDIRPLQVLIEVLIVEARKNSTFSLGAAVNVPPQSIGSGTVGGHTTGTGSGDLVVSLMHMGRGDVSALLATAESHGDVEILSRPVLIAANNTEATFMVGSKRAFPVLRRQLPTDGGVTTQDFEYRDVGTRLTILPTINYDGYVSLEVLQEINQVAGDANADLPTISSREAHTQVLAKDGQTIVLGGLRDRSQDGGTHGVPFLSRIPFLGGFFGGATRNSSETELFLFLTPRILRTDADVDSATAGRMPAQARGLR